MLLLLALAVRAAAQVDPVQADPAQGGRRDPYTAGPAQRYPLPVTRQAPPNLAAAGQADEGQGQPARAASAPVPNGEAAPTATAETDSESPPAYVPSPNDLFKPGQIIARVGGQVILYGEVAPIVNQQLEPALAKAKNKYERAEIESYREMLTQQALHKLVESKVMYAEFERSLIGQAGDKIKDAKKKINENVRQNFEKNLFDVKEKLAQAKSAERDEMLRKDPVIPRLALAMVENKLETIAELDPFLKRYGDSLDKELARYSEHNLGLHMLSQRVNFKPDVTHDEMREYYRKHPEKFALPAKAKFEILTAKFANQRGDRAATWKAVADMGNSVVQGGTPFEAVAKKFSQESHAPEGGKYDWTSQGSLASKVIDEAIFTLPLNLLSDILEDERGFHILRVIDRKGAGVVPFTEAQAGIKQAISSEKREVKYREYTAKLRQNTVIWTIYDDQPQIARPGARPGRERSR